MAETVVFGDINLSCTATTATDYQCEPPPMTPGAAAATCPYNFAYESSVADGARIGAIGLHQFLNGNVWMTLCRPQGVDPAAPETGWSLLAGIGPTDSASASIMTLFFNGPTPGDTSASFTRGKAQLRVENTQNATSAANGFAPVVSPAADGFDVVYWFTGLNSAEPIAGTAALNYNGPDGTNETVQISFTPDAVVQDPGTFPARFPSAVVVADG